MWTVTSLRCRVLCVDLRAGCVARNVTRTDRLRLIAVVCTRAQCTTHAVGNRPHSLTILDGNSLQFLFGVPFSLSPSRPAARISDQDSSQSVGRTNRASGSRADRLQLLRPPRRRVGAAPAGFTRGASGQRRPGSHGERRGSAGRVHRGSVGAAPAGFTREA